jgi:hypothetical protein
VHHVNDRTPDRSTPVKPGLKDRAADELRRFLEVSAYLFVCFAVLLFYRNAVLSEEGVTTISLGFAAGKALILGKFLLLGESAGIGKRWHASSLWIAILRQALLMWILLLVLSVLEEFLLGLLHGHSLAQTFADYRAHSVLEMLAKSVVLLMVLLPMIATIELSRALGPGVLRGLLLAAERKEEGPGAS